MIKNKKGVFDIIYLIVILFGIALIGLFVFYLADQFSSGYQDMQEIQETQYAKSFVDNWRASLPYINDGLIFLFFIGMVIGLLVSAVRTNFSPVVIGLFIILLLITIFIASGLVNMYRGVADSEEVIDYSSKLTFTNIIFSKYTPAIIMVLSTIILIIMWGKSGNRIIT
jgi:hypothetical protein